MAKKPAPVAPPERPEDRKGLPLRWAVILSVACLAGIAANAAAGPAAGITAFVLVAGLLHTIVD